MLNDAESYLNHSTNWTPQDGAKLPNGDLIQTIGEFVRFAGIPA